MLLRSAVVVLLASGCRLNFDTVPDAKDAQDAASDGGTCTFVTIEQRGDGTCSDGVDNDCNGLADHDDPACPRLRVRSIGGGPVALHTTTADIDGGVATLAAIAPAPVGIGDVVVLPGPTLAFVRERIADNKIRLVDVNGAPFTMVLANAAFDVYRAYTDLNDLESLLENSAIPTAVRDFDGDRDLVAADVAIAFALYADDVETSTTDISGWTTSREHYIRLFSPTAKRDVGVSQRHTGVFGGATIEAGDPFPALEIYQSHVRIEGLSIRAYGQGTNLSGLLVFASAPDIDVRVDHSILDGNGADSTDGILHLEADGAGAGGIFRVSNNIVYAAPTGTAECMWHRDANGASALFYIFNNTAFDCPRAIEARDTAGKAIAINNVAFGANDGLFGPIAFYEYNGPGEYSALSSNNVSGDTTASAIGTAGLINIDPAQTLRNIADPIDLRLQATAAIGGTGRDLRIDANLPVIDDIEGQLRPATGTDPGADQR